jgi:hypothetical protein
MTTPINPNDRGLWTSASSAAADQACPGRHLAQRGIPDIKSADAESGTLVHDALCKGSSAGLGLEETELFDRCQAIEQELLIRCFGPEIATMKAFPDREKRLWISWVQAGGLQHSGQPDAVFRYKAKALVVDYKTGRNEVAVSPKNMQMRDLAVLTWVNKALLNECAVAVIQPWVTNTPEICVYTKDDIGKAVTQMLARVQASNDPSAPRVAGEIQCKYCRAKSKCAEYSKWAGALVPVGDKSIVDIPVDDWSPAQCAIFLNNLGRAEKWLADCKEKMKELITLDPNAIPGWSVKPGNVVEKIKDAQTVFDRFSEMGGSLEQFMGCITVGKTKLKESVAAITKKKGKGLNELLDTITAGCVESKQSAPTLEKLGDK